MEKFTRLDLNSGMVVTTRNGNSYLVVLNSNSYDSVMIRVGGWLTLREYDLDLANRSDSSYDIMMVFKTSFWGNVMENFYKGDFKTNINWEVVYDRDSKLEKIANLEKQIKELQDEVNLLKTK